MRRRRPDPNNPLEAALFKAGMLPRDLAIRAGISEPTLSAIRRGAKPGYLTAWRIVNVLNEALAERGSPLVSKSDIFPS